MKVISIDKLLHFLASYFIASVMIIFFRWCGISVIHAIIFALACGVVKEIIDISQRGFTLDSLWDLVSDIFGVGFAYIII